MPFQNVIEEHFTPAEQAAYNAIMAQLEALLQPKLVNLTPEENQTYGTIDEQNKLFVNKVRDYYHSQPHLSSPDVDWAEFDLDAADRSFLENGALRLEGLMRALTETRRLHDYDNYQNSLLDYRYTEYKTHTETGSGYDTKYEELKQFFTHDGIPPAPQETITFATKQNPVAPMSISLLGADGLNVYFRWNDGTGDTIIVVNSSTTTAATHLYGAIGNYSIQALGERQRHLLRY